MAGKDSKNVGRFKRERGRASGGGSNKDQKGGTTDKVNMQSLFHDSQAAGKKKAHQLLDTPEPEARNKLVNLEEGWPFPELKSERRPS